MKIRLQNTRLRKVTFWNSPFNKIVEHEEFVIIYTSKVIDSEKCCGVVNHWYFISKTETLCEFKNFNSCLNKKISIDGNGNIKNCPSMPKSFGNISTTTLRQAFDNSEFKALWSITKDQINGCKDCEFRYICQDCRAYLVDKNDIYSKPLKCSYNPYE